MGVKESPSNSCGDSAARVVKKIFGANEERTKVRVVRIVRKKFTENGRVVLEVVGRDAFHHVPNSSSYVHVQ